MSRFLRRPAIIGLVAVLQIAAASGCASKPSDLQSSAAQPRSAPPSAAAPEYLPWQHDVPAAFITNVAVPGTRQRGVLIASRWVTRTGSVIETSPGGRVLTWPAALPVHRPDRVHLSIPVSVLPVRVEIRQFAGPLDQSGVPMDDSETLVCEKDPSTTSQCTYRLDQDGVAAAILPSHTSHPLPFLVFYAQWYIPIGQRPDGAKGNPVINASWGFQLRIDR